MEIKRVRLNVPAIEAVQITKDNIIEVAAWAGGSVKKYRAKEGEHPFKVVIPTETGLIEGESHHVGDWLFRNPTMPGLVSSMPDDMFNSVYIDATLTTCMYCKEEKDLSEMARDSRGIPLLHFCRDCEAKQVAEINERRAWLQEKLRNEGTI